MSEILYLWEDDYLMIELLPFENLEFIKAETKRIANFGETHFDGSSFTDITPIGEKPVKTIDKLIDISAIEKIIIDAGLLKVEKIHPQVFWMNEQLYFTLAYGNSKFAIIVERKNKLLEHIWFSGHVHEEAVKQKLIEILLSLGRLYKFTGVNWYKCEYYHLTERESVEDFINGF